jgi:sulfonate transport system substrate-binding protein
MPAAGYAYASQQKVADTFSKAGVIAAKVYVKQLWDSTFSEDIAQCK